MGNTFQIASWLVQPSLNAVSLNGTTVRLEPKVMEVLVFLAAHPGETIPKEKLIQVVWPGTFVTDDVLTRSIFELRRVFGDDAKESHVIQTIPKRGYRLVAPVKVMPDSQAACSPASGTAESNAVVTPVGWRHRFAMLGIAGALLLIGLGAAFKNDWVRDRLGVAKSPSIHSLAVLPLQNLSGDPAQEYFADGMTEELITELSRLNGLTVISRTSVMRYKKTDKSLPEIARDLNVDAVVEGSVLRSGDRVRVTAQLISPRTDANLWAETYDRSLQDTLAVQEEVAMAIAGKVKTSMVPGAAKSKTTRQVNLKAHEAYLLGLHEDDLAVDMANHQGMKAFVEERRRRAIQYYEQALKEDPTYAPAYLALAGGLDGAESNDVVAKARKALELDDSLSEAHLKLGSVLLARDLNWQEAEKEFRRAIEVNPNYAPAHQGYAYYLDALGKLDEGLKEYHRAQELDPANDHLGAALYARRDYDRLIELERRTLSTNPPGENDANAIAHKVLMVAYARTGRQKESIEELSSAIACMGFHDFAEEIRRGYVSGGYHGALRAYLSGAKKRPEWVFDVVGIYVHAELGDYDQAFTQLARWNKNSDVYWQWVVEADALPTPASLRIEPMWDPLHSDPRFEELARQLGLPAESVSQSQD